LNLKVTQVIKISSLENMFSPDFVAALNECVSDNNPKAFGLLIRSEIVSSHLYQEGKDQELIYLMEYLKDNFSEKYFRASIQAIIDFLLKLQFSNQVTHGEIQISLNSICQLLVATGGLENKSQAMVEVASQLETTRQAQKTQHLRFEEISSQEKIVENRKFPGQLKVFASWYLIWNTIHQIAWDLILTIVICNIITICTTNNLPLLRGGRILLAACTSIAHINMRMDSKAKKRWKAKYG
jgi:hypothetical protein